jgi:hypothetical protein
VRGLAGRRRCRPFLFAFRHRDHEPASGPGKQQGSGATFSSERSERVGERCEPKAVAGPCASGPPVMIEGRKGKKGYR